MKKFAILLFLLTSLSCSGQIKKAATIETTLINRIIRLENTMRKFESKYQDDAFRSSYADSIERYNTLLSHALLDNHIKNLDSAGWRKIVGSSDITLLKSADRKIGVVSWFVYNPYPNKQCSTILINEKYVKAVSLTDTKDGAGDNIAIDQIIDVTLNDKTNYILIGANKCGNLCVQYVASIFEVADGSITQRQKAFFDGTEHLDEVEFDYRLSDEIETDPLFRVEGDQLICPVFNTERTKQIGTKKYTILP